MVAVAKIWKESTALPVFVALQCMDVLTTLLFLNRGMAEGNPLVNWALSSAHTPLVALLAAKLVAGLAGYLCYRRGRLTLLRRINIGYGLVVGWNLLGIAFILLPH